MGTFIGMAVATLTMPNWKLERNAGSKALPRLDDPLLTAAPSPPLDAVCHSLVDQRRLLQGRWGDVRIRVDHILYIVLVYLP
jgi:hypothetical protein